MSLPPGFLDELRTRLTLSDVVGRKVLWDQRKSNQAKGDFWAPCPFHHEKTASFHVDDRKGFYYCFGCHQKGDAITFVRESENMGFMEAVELLAGEAGLQMPARDPKAREMADRRSVLADAMEQAVQHFRLQLKTGAAAEARAYLAGRGLDDAALTRWDIGFAPDQRQGVFGHLTGKGVPAQDVVDAGLAAMPDAGGTPYDRFRGRIVFPIRNAQGRVVALGGRAMDPNARAKYLNSPETLLFDKSRSLYNHGPAREAVGKGQPLIVAEGYMDVIALVEAGFAGAVAPLGTAITEHQLQMLWRMAPEPIIALDGDTAGLRAAMRLIDLVLPQLEAGRSLRFCLMLAGQDPDDLIRTGGGGPAMQALIDQARPLVQLLWQRETEGRVFDSPERRAALDKALRDATARIPDQMLRARYDEEIKRLKWDLFRPAKPAWVRRTGGKWTAPPAGATPGTRNSVLARTAEAVGEDRLREAVILAVLVTHPRLVAEFAGELENMDCHSADHAAIRNMLLSVEADNPQDLKEKIAATSTASALENLLAHSHISVVPAIRKPEDGQAAALCLAEEFKKLGAYRGAEREIREAMEDIDRLADEGLTWRLTQAARARDRAVHGSNEDTTEYDTAPSGARMSRDERSAFDALISGIAFSKSGKPSS